MVKKENKENNINLEDLQKLLDESVDDAVHKIERHLNEESKVDNLKLMFFSLQNKVAIIEYKILLEEKLGLRKEK